MWALSAEHSNSLVISVGLFALIFLIGWFEGWALQSRELPKYTWGLGLVGLVILIGFPLTPLRIVLALTILISGVLAIRWYERVNAGQESDSSAG